MNFNEYQLESRGFAVYPNRNRNLIYPSLGLAGETGGFVENVKKAIRDQGYREGLDFPSDRRKKAIEELGDALWYISNCATELNISLEDVALQNINKLIERKMKGKIHGR